MKLEAEIKNIKKILVDDEKFYQIPDYQRPYSWDKDNLSDLIDDLTNAFSDNPTESYFCGSLVLVDNTGDNRLDIIDGQQRTTTFTIIACVFRDVYIDKLSLKAKKYIKNSIQDEFEEDKRKLRFLTDVKYQNNFEQTVLKKIDYKKVKSIQDDIKHNKYLQNAYYLRDFIAENIEEKKIDINDFIIWFYEHVALSVITCPDQNSAIQIFNVLNDRGMPLSSIDILKSSLMQKLSDNKEDRNMFKNEWQDINSNLKFAELSIEDMLTTFLYYKLTANPKSRLDKELLNIFDKEKKDALTIVNEIKDFSNAYIAILTQEDKHIYCLKYLKHKIYWNSILTTAEFVKYPNMKELKEILVAYYYQNWISGATVARIKQTSFNILTHVKNKSELSDIKEEMQKNLDKYKTTKIFKDEILYSDIYGRKWDKSLLLLVEYFSEEDEYKKFIPISSKLHLEHILPQTLSKGWENIFTKEELDDWTNSLANLTLLSMRKNIQASNSSFTLKKKAYADTNNVVTPFIITQSILKCSKWDVEELEKREEQLVSKINEKLDLFN